MHRAAVVIVAACALGLSSCVSQTNQPSSETNPTELTVPLEDSPRFTWPVTIETDELSVAEVDVPILENNGRVLALAVGSGEVADLLGAGNQLVGKDETSSTSREVPTVTQAHQIDIEQAVSLRPTVVLVDDLTGPPEAIDALSASGAKIINIPSVWTLNDINDRVSAIADAIGASAESARELSAALTQNTEVSNSASPRVAFLYLRGPSAIYLLGGESTGADALIEAAGGIDVGAELGYDGFVPLTAEAIIEADPEVLLVMKDGLESVGGIDGLLELPGVEQTRAGENRRVVVVEDQVLLSFGARTPALISRLAEVFTEGLT